MKGSYIKIAVYTARFNLLLETYTKNIIFWLNLQKNLRIFKKKLYKINQILQILRHPLKPINSVNQNDIINSLLFQNIPKIKIHAVKAIIVKFPSDHCVQKKALMLVFS